MLIEHVMEGVSMNNLLTREEKYKISLFFYLLNSDRERTIQEIRTYLNLSYYKVTKLIDLLNEDIHTYYSPKFTLIEKKAHGGISIKSNANFLLNLLIAEYYQNNMVFKLLNKKFIEDDYNVYAFANEHFVSLSYAYSVANHLEHLLEGYGLGLDHQLNIIGDELTIRNLYYSIYIVAYSNTQVLFPGEMMGKTNNLLNAVKEYFNIKCLSEVDLKKLRIYLTIFLNRVERGYVIDGSIFTDSQPTTQFVQYLEETFGLSETQAAICCKEIRYFLEVEKMLPISTTLISSKLLSTVYDKTNWLMENLSRWNLKLKKEVMADYAFQQIKDFFHQVMLWHNKRVDDLFFIRQDYFEKLFPKAALLIAYLFSSDEPVLFNEPTYIHVIFLFLCVSDSLFDALHSKSVRVQLEFNEGMRYRQIIATKLLTEMKLDIVLVDEDPDIIITDKPSWDSVDNMTLVWSYPPNINDWANLKKLFLLN